MSPLQEMYSALPVLSTVFPVVLIIAIACISEAALGESITKPSRHYRCWAWYAVSIAILLLLVLKGDLLDQIILRLFHDEWPVCAIIPLPVAVTAMGIWRPLWSGKGTPLMLKALPILLTLAALLGPLSGYISVLFLEGWFGMLVIEPLFLVLLVIILVLSIRDYRKWGSMAN
jgi:hypothetical protein